MNKAIDFVFNKKKYRIEENNKGRFTVRILKNGLGIFKTRVIWEIDGCFVFDPTLDRYFDKDRVVFPSHYFEKLFLFKTIFEIRKAMNYEPTRHIR